MLRPVRWYSAFHTLTVLNLPLIFAVTSLTTSTSNVIELHVKTVKYFKSIERVQEEVERTQRALAEHAAGGELRIGDAVAVGLSAASIAKSEIRTE